MKVGGVWGKISCDLEGFVCSEAGADPDHARRAPISYSIGPPHLLTSTVLTFDRHPRAELGHSCGFGMKSACCGINSCYRRAITLAIVTRRRQPCLTGGYYRRECLGYNRREIGERSGCGATF